MVGDEIGVPGFRQATVAEVAVGCRGGCNAGGPTGFDVAPVVADVGSAPGGFQDTAGVRDQAGWLAAAVVSPLTTQVVWLRRLQRKPADRCRVRLLVTIPQECRVPGGRRAIPRFRQRASVDTEVSGVESSRKAGERHRE